MRFADIVWFVLVTSNPGFPQSNGKSERVVQVVKNLLQKSTDACNTLLAYRATALECGYSAAELLMDTQLHTSIPLNVSVNTATRLAGIEAATGTARESKMKSATYCADAE